MRDWPMGWLFRSVMTAAVAFVAIPGALSAPPGDTSTETEEAIVGRIKKLGALDLTGYSEKQRFAAKQQTNQLLVEEVDSLLKRFPESDFKEDALILQLKALADLARFHPGYLSRLRQQTERNAKGHPSNRLASENAYYAIQAFVYGARLEKMPAERRLRGTQERYEAFIEDYPNSPHNPVIRASLVRNLLAQKQPAKAREQYLALANAYPKHEATRRAAGEIYRTEAVGKPFGFAYVTPKGESIRTTDYLGKVLVIHFWATWSPTSMEELKTLVELNSEFADQGLSLIGVNVDKDGDKAHEAVEQNGLSWPQYYDYKGLENDLLVMHGVLKLPTYFIVDRKGILRSIDSGDNLESLIGELLNEPTTPSGK